MRSAVGAEFRRGVRQGSQARLSGGLPPVAGASGWMGQGRIGCRNPDRQRVGSVRTMNAPELTGWIAAEQDPDRARKVVEAML